MNLHEFYLAVQLANQNGKDSDLSDCCSAGIAELQLNGTDIYAAGKTVLIEEEEAE